MGNAGGAFLLEKRLSLSKPHYKPPNKKRRNARVRARGDYRETHCGVNGDFIPTASVASGEWQGLLGVGVAFAHRFPVDHVEERRDIVGPAVLVV